MLISVVNHTQDLKDEEVQFALRAINRQITEDFAPYWHMSANLRLEGKAGKQPDPKTLRELRGDAVLYIWDGEDGDDALGYHDQTQLGIPYGFVFTKLAKELDESWTATLSHEALELLADPDANLLVQGPHPNDRRRVVFHWFEMCDAVQDESYEVDGIELSNFLLPLYFTSDAELGGRNDFLGARKGRKTLNSFGIAPGGYIGFYNPETRDHETFALKSDERAKERARIKAKASMTRRSKRYGLGPSYREQVEQVMQAATGLTADTITVRTIRAQRRALGRRVREALAVEKIGSEKRRP